YPYLLMTPAVLLVGVGILYPVVYLAYLSLHEYSPFFTAGVMRFVGLANYSRLLDDPEFWHALRVSAIWVVGSVIPQFLLGLGMALLLNERFAGRGAVRTIILAPWAVSGVITAIIWGWIFDGTVGVLNDLLLRMTIIERPIAWSLQPATTWFMVFVANAWRGAPFFAIMLLAALQSINPDLYESAKVDGASPWQRFRSITLPLILNTVIVATLLRSIWTFNYIDLLWTMTHGGPIDATRTLPITVFDTAYLNGDFGYAASLAVALCLILLTFGALYWRLNRFAHDADG
ncbi:MAG: carbohydrate ABC transporter permease, partial [Thermomicrobiales bacterium]